MTFHLERLEIYASDLEAWNSVDCIAFETIPLLREVRAIRRAMARVLRSGVSPKPWWISFVFPDGKFPGNADTQGARHSAEYVANVTFDQSRKDMATPHGIGVNCTDMYNEPVIEMTRAINTLAPFRPWLVLYPNGGFDYDTASKTWARPSPSDDSKGKMEDVWTRRVTSLLSDVRASWGGIIVGGCCKCCPLLIQRLAEEVRSMRD